MTEADTAVPTRDAADVTAYATSRKNGKRTFHLDRNCRRLQRATETSGTHGYQIREVDLDTFPPAWRDWCGTCAPDGLDTATEGGVEADD